MVENQLGKYAEAMHERLTALYQQGVHPLATLPDLLPRFLMELGNASEEMQIAMEKLQK